MINHRRRRFCGKHKAKDRTWNDYSYSFTSNGIDYYECIVCKEALQKIIERDNRIEANIQKQKEEKYQRQRIKWLKKSTKRKQDMQEQLWDEVVKKDLLRGVKNCYKLPPIPKELLQLKRATMNLHRAIKLKKEDLKNKLEQQELEDKRNKEREAKILSCHIHGKLRWDQVVKSGVRQEIQQYRCVFCNRAMGRKSWNKNKNKRNLENENKKHSES